MTAKQGERFFAITGYLLLALVVAGFAPSFVARPEYAVPITPLLHVHAVILLSWFVLFLVQARLIGNGNVLLHMRLGKLSILLAVTIVMFGYLVIRAAYARPEFSIAGMSPAASVIFPFTDIANFIIAYSLAIANRRRPAAHKRLMLLAGILIIDPAVARFVAISGLPIPAILLLELALFAALFTYDIRTRGRPHWASVAGLVLYIAALIAKFTIASSAPWTTFVDLLFAW